MIQVSHIGFIMFTIKKNYGFWSATLEIEDSKWHMAKLASLFNPFIQCWITTLLSQQGSMSRGFRSPLKCSPLN